MKLSVIAVLLYLACATAAAQQVEYEWKTTVADVEKDHKLDLLTIPGLLMNLQTFLGDEETSLYSVYALDNMKQQEICEVDLLTVMGFYRDSLAFVVRATEELPYTEDGAQGECLISTIFGEGTSLLWRPIFKSAPMDGDIFWEGGSCAYGEGENEYLTMLNSTGTITDPQHCQYALFRFDRALLDDVLQNRMRIHPDYKERLHPTALFVEYIADEFD